MSSLSGSEKREAESRDFFDAIGRPELREKITSLNPFTYFSMEYYGDGMKGGGGLGVLAGDTRKIAEKAGLPLVVVTPFYSRESHQEIHDFKQYEKHIEVTPEEKGFKKLDKKVTINTASHSNIHLHLYGKDAGSTRIVGIYDHNIGELYQGQNNDDHRLYQEVVAGFGGHKALNVLGLAPSVMQLNEAPTVFASISMVDSLVKKGMRLEEALDEVRGKTLYTNHTLVQAVEAEFNSGQFAHFVMPNITSDKVKNWVSSKFRHDKIKLSTLAIELSGKRNGVSKLHAREASDQYVDFEGNFVKFEGVTNGIALDNWVNPGFIELDQRCGIIDSFGLPAPDYERKIKVLDVLEQRKIKAEGRIRMNEVLSRRLDQYGQHPQIPEDGLIYTFKRRLAEYKRAGMLLDHPDTLALILEATNGYLLISGKPHASDGAMKLKLTEMLNTIDSNDILRKRVIYMQDYDAELGRALSEGADIAINVPEVKKEACGTSFMKDIANRAIIISTNDGGIADVQPPACLEVKGSHYGREVVSLYKHMIEAADIVEDDQRWKQQIALQYHSYPNIFGGKMLKEYINLLFTKDKLSDSEDQQNARNVIYLNRNPQLA